jgi:membrane fusion protein (multidrug efflux system)
MRTSLLALLLLVVVGAIGYAAVNDKLPEPLSAPAERVVTWARGLLGGSAEAEVPRAAAASPAGARVPEGRASVPVEVARAQSTASQSAIRSVGTMMSDESVNISAEQAGRIAEIRFREGDQVKSGDVLLKLDDALLTAELTDARSRLVLAESNFGRATTLTKSGAGTGRALDEARAAQETARAAVELAEVRLSKTLIRAPFDGTVGLRGQSSGAYLTPGQIVVNLEKIDVLKLDFKVAELFLNQVRPGQPVEVALDAFPGHTFTGEIYAIDPMVDVNGRSLSIRARLDNKDRLLRPGLFARVAIKRKAGEKIVIVPEGAIVPRSNGPVVFRVQDGKAVETPVKLGERRSGAVEIISGVAAEDTVVTAGHARLRNGASIEIVTAQARTPS